MSTESINFAIQDCFSECVAAHEPLTCLAGFLKQLRELRHWSEDDIREVDTAIRHLLVPLLGRSALVQETLPAANEYGPSTRSDAAVIRPD